jgi:hypothetical protein
MAFNEIGNLQLKQKYTVMIWIPDQSGILMLDLRPVVEWSDMRTASEYPTNLSGFWKVRYLDNHYKNRTFLSRFWMVH